MFQKIEQMFQMSFQAKKRYLQAGQFNNSIYGILVKTHSLVCFFPQPEVIE